MRLQRGQKVAGLDPELARALVKAARLPANIEHLAWRTKLTDAEAQAAVEQMAEAGYLQRKNVFWETTDEGNALAMATFAKPIRRVTADRLLAGVLDRTREYNADDGKPYVIAKVTIFGSYLDPEVTELGDVDIAIKLEKRVGGQTDPDDLQVMANYWIRSGRQLSTFIDRMAWPAVEPFVILKNRSSYLSIHDEDPATFTDRWKVI